MAENWTKDRKDNSAETEIMASKAPTSLLFFTFYEETGANVLQSMNDLSSFDDTSLMNFFLFRWLANKKLFCTIVIS